MFESLNVMSGYFSAAAHVSVVPEPAATSEGSTVELQRRLKTRSDEC